MPATRGSEDLKTLIGEAVRQIMADEEFIIAIVTKVTISLQEKFNEVNRKQQEDIDLLKDKIALLECRNENLEQCTRSNTVRIFGVKEKPSENTEQVVIDLVNSHLKVNIDGGCIDRAHRLPSGNGNNRCKPIIVKFNSFKWKQLVYSMRRQFKGTNIYMYEDLTREKADLLRQTKQTFNNTPVWTNGGKIFVKCDGMIHKILNLKEFEALNVKTSNRRK